MFHDDNAPGGDHPGDDFPAECRAWMHKTLQLASLDAQEAGVGAEHQRLLARSCC